MMQQGGSIIHSGWDFVQFKKFHTLLLAQIRTMLLAKIVTKRIQYNASQIGIDMQIYRINCAFSIEKD